MIIFLPLQLPTSIPIDSYHHFVSNNLDEISKHLDQKLLNNFIVVCTDADTYIQTLALFMYSDRFMSAQSQKPCLLSSLWQNWYELQLQQIQQWLEKRPEFSLHAAQVQASRALTDVRVYITLMHGIVHVPQTLHEFGYYNFSFLLSSLFFSSLSSLSPSSLL